jgi:carbon storage regulator
MLVLNRKMGERIRIEPDLEITVLGIHKGRVKLGFAGPPEVLIRREELVGSNCQNCACETSDERRP